MGDRTEELMDLLFQRQVQEQESFDKLSEEEKGAVLVERQAKRIKDGWAAMRSSNWRRGR